MKSRVVLACLAGLLLTACGATTPETARELDPPDGTVSASPSDQTQRDQAEDDQPKPGHEDQTTEAAPVPETLAFSATTVAGESFDGASLAGRPTLLWFWAPWCPTCRSQIPQVEGLASTYDGDLNVIGVGSLDSADAIAEFADDVSGVTHLEDSDGELFKRFGITEQSSFVLLDADGSVAYETGYGGSDDLGQQVEAVLG